MSTIGLFSPFSASLERQEKVTMGLTAMLTLVVLLLIITELMPKSATSFPHLGKYILIEIAVTAVSTLFAVAIMYVHTKAENGGYPPKWLLKLVLLSDDCNGKEEFIFTNGDVFPDQVCVTTKIVKENSVQSDKNVYATLLLKILSYLKDMSNKQRMLESENARKEIWGDICWRLDIVFLIAFCVFNAIVTFIHVMFY
jgi:hypothetical protein